jgi:hypothetical protein
MASRSGFISQNPITITSDPTPDPSSITDLAANLVSCWAPAYGNGIPLTSTNSTYTYNFPSYNFKNTFNGQLITIFNNGPAGTAVTITITLANINIALQRGNTYSTNTSNTTYTLPVNTIETYVLTKDNYWVRIISTTI